VSLINKFPVASNNKLFSDAYQINFNFGEIRDLFRQHVNNRKTIQDDSKVLLSQSQITKLISLKETIENIHQKFNDLNATGDEKNFSSIVDFMSNISNQQEILSLELWKLERLIDYVEKNVQIQEQKFSSPINKSAEM
jgi:hypothetical protein